MPTTFIMHSGLRTIGGVVFSVTHGNDRVVMEMGSAYNPSTDVYDGIVERRPAARVRDAIRAGRAPEVDGIYAAADLQGFRGLVPAEESELNTAIFISHLHLDHMGAIGFVAPSVPIYMHDAAVRIERALEDVGDGVETTDREYRGFEHGTPVLVGDVEVLPLITNRHSYQEYAFLVTTPDGTIYWTGDLSLHSTQAELTFDHIDVLRARGLDVMLCDTTAFMDSVLLQTNGTTEATAIMPSHDVPTGMLDGHDVDRELFEILGRQQSLVVFNFYQREVEEGRRYIEWARRVGRRCLFEPDAAYLLWRFFGECPEIYVPDSARYPASPSAQAPWFREVVAVGTVVPRDEVLGNPSGFLVQNSYPHILELFDLASADAAYLHVDGIPIGDFDPAFQNLRRVVDQAGFTYVTFFNQSYFGHGYPPQVKYFCDEVDPKVLVPCHGFNPERLLPKSGVQLLPELGRPYALAGGRLTPVPAPTR